MERELTPPPPKTSTRPYDRAEVFGFDYDNHQQCANDLEIIRMMYNRSKWGYTLVAATFGLIAGIAWGSMLL